MSNRYELMTQEQLDEHWMEIKNRLKNLFWTVSGDYSLDVEPDLKTFIRSKNIALYDGVKQGAFAKYFDTEKLSLYLMKKLYAGAQETPLMELTQLCVDAAVYPVAVKERRGIDEIKKQAYQDILKLQKKRLRRYLFGRVKLAAIERFLGEEEGEYEAAVYETMNQITLLEGTRDTEEVIGVIDRLYNRMYDTTFEEKHGNLKQILNMNPADIAQAAWQDCLTDEQMEDIIKLYLSNLGKDAVKLEIDDKPRLFRPASWEKQMEQDDAAQETDVAAVKKVHEYVELNYGKSYLKPHEQERKNRSYCRDIHKNCTLHFTEGVIHDPVKVNNQYRFNQLQFEKNRFFYGNNHWIVKRNIANLTDTLRNALLLRNQEEVIRWNTGELAANRMWKLGRTKDEKLFNRTIKEEESRFVVDVLLDCSGSQTARQPQVAIQGFIISEALSAVEIPHRVVSYCSFWDHTILHRFRDYDDRRDMNNRIFEFRASGDNRDGLALKATSAALSERREEHKILIVLSDGKPCDMGTRRPGTRMLTPYVGEDAIKDTALEVRRARTAGISVLGIFAGSEEDLGAEKKIYGKDFAYIRNISNFSQVVGSYLRRQIDKDL